ncbi:hypothetical protein QJS10_CPA06g01778 [Acorus calamus]|uniref:Uncharacterized protein n=1 Tax=Acorus calamus TaxID=4465 RepID=A0AAV9EQP3_ACOCL|nr:hypothetical protein QJS10_CPA06g01778 [Acorus calamus]
MNPRQCGCWVGFDAKLCGLQGDAQPESFFNSLQLRNCHVSPIEDGELVYPRFSEGRLLYKFES